MNTRSSFCTGLLAALATITASASCLAADQNKIPVILDTDIGDDIDDTWALVMLLKSPQLDVKLVTTTFGKAEYRAKIVARILTVAGRTDIPVGLGAGGRDGVGGQQAWVADFQLKDYRGKIHEDGVGALIETINRAPQPLTVIAIGPLNTVAAALERDPQIAGKAGFSGMHGSVRKGYGGGPVSAEWNVKANAKACKTVLSAPWRQIAITPLDTCGLVNLAGPRFQTLAASQDPLVKALLENYRIWAKKDQVSQLNASSVLFDTAAVYLAYPGERPLMKLETLTIAVTDDGFTRIDAAGKSMAVATEWKNLDAYRDLLVQVLTAPR
jgi:inosine-uridine nucleoside N-ribohydrolase